MFGTGPSTIFTGLAILGGILLAVDGAPSNDRNTRTCSIDVVLKLICIDNYSINFDSVYEQCCHKPCTYEDLIRHCAPDFVGRDTNTRNRIRKPVKSNDRSGSATKTGGNDESAGRSGVRGINDTF